MSIATSGTETRVNSTTAGDQTAPKVIALNEGGYAVVWDTLSGWSFQRFTAEGAAIGGEIALPDPVMPADGTHYFTGAPYGYDYTGPIDFDIVELPDGTFLYAYSVNVAYGSYSNYHQMAYIGIVGDEGTVIRPASWTLFSGGDGSIELELLPGGGSLLRVHHLLFDVNFSTWRLDYSSSLYSGTWVGVSGWDLVPAPDGRLLATWYDADEGTQAQYISTAGDLTGPILDLPIPQGAAIMHGDGELYFAWIEADAEGNSNVAVGTTDGSSFDAYWLSGADTTPSDVRLWQLGDGRLLATWTAASGGDGDGNSVMGQLVAEGVPIGEAFVINSNSSGDQSAVSIVALEGGLFVATWQGPGSDGDGFDIASQIFDPRSLTGTDGDDLLIGGAFDDTIVAGDGADALSGEAGNDSIDAGGGNDWIYGSAGDDTVGGGEGDDIYLVGGTRPDWIVEYVDDDTFLLHWHDDPSYGTKMLVNVESIGLGDDREFLLADLLSNSAPIAHDDDNASDAVREIDDTSAQGNLLSNDEDADLEIGERLTVVSAQFGSNAAIAIDVDGAAIDGTYGTLIVRADGSYLYTLDSSSIAVEALRSTDVRSETFIWKRQRCESRDRLVRWRRGRK
jgi:VCBS repeat-containing protein